MKRKFIVFGLLASSFFSYGQKKADSVYKKQRVSKTDVQALFSFYTQDGDHSAITGGIGTENLQVYAPKIIISALPDSLNTYTTNFGVDIVTSASADNIDFVKSSVSRVDARSYVNVGYERKLHHSNTHFGFNTGASVESAYTSIPAGVSFDHISKDASREVSVALQCFFDDLRWGRLAKDLGYPKELVYPYELRYKKWFDIYKRNSYNLSFALYQVVNARTQLAIFPELVYQSGLLVTPYHRVFFTDHSEKVENLPTERWKIPLGFQLNRFVGGRFIIRARYRFYWDNFGISAHTLQIETPVKINPVFSIAPLVRLYTQTAADYFQPYARHNIAEQYYTSDYDLSAFNSFEFGAKLRYAPHSEIIRKLFFSAAELRYSHYKRNDNLGANMVSVLFDFDHTALKK
jgi:hypothetical protein